jgi:hypothetical protein
MSKKIIGICFIADGHVCIVGNATAAAFASNATTVGQRTLCHIVEQTKFCELAPSWVGIPFCKSPKPGLKHLDGGGGQTKLLI